MTNQELEKMELESQLERVKQRLLLLDMIDERLLSMKALAQRVRDDDLSDEAMQKLSEQVRDLEEQIRLLERKGTQLS